jgi:hypothetical protein
MISICQGCGARAPTRNVYFVQWIGAVIMLFHKRIRGKLCRNCVNKYFGEYFGTTLLLGWWHPASFFLTPFVLLIDLVNYVPAAIALRSGRSAPSTTTTRRTAAPARPSPPRPQPPPPPRAPQEPTSPTTAIAARGSVACPAVKCRKPLRVPLDIRGQVKCRRCGHVFTCRNQTRMIRQALGVGLFALVGGVLLWLRHPPAPPELIR